MALVVFVKGASQGSRVRLEGDRITLGRNADCGVVVSEPAVSREHAVIRRIQGAYFIEDLKSRNGTFLNNKEVKTRTQLKDRDRIKVCDTIIAFYENTVSDDASEAPEEERDESSTIEATLASTGSKALFTTQPAEKLAMLIELGQELSRTFDLTQLLPKVAESLFNVFKQADRVFVILAEEGRLVPKVVKTRRATEDANETRFSRKIVTMCMETGQSLLWEDAASGKVVELTASIADVKIRSVMCVPLMTNDPANPKAFGVIQLDTLDRFKKFSQDDLKLLLSVAGQASVAIENSRMHESLLTRVGLERDLRLAQEVQKSFLPKTMPTAAGYQFFAHYESAQEIGGDYYDFIPLQSSRVGVMIGDVAGKGVPAALFMAKLSADARFCALTESSLDVAVTRLNVFLSDAGLLDRFVTLGACVVDPATHQVTCVNAGHMPPLVFRAATKEFETPVDAEGTGFPLGVVDGFAYEARSFHLDKGDAVLLFTDGVTESKNVDGADFQMEGVHKALRAGPMAAQPMIERVMAAIKKHAAGRKPHDDITLVSFARLT